VVAHFGGERCVRCIFDSGPGRRQELHTDREGAEHLASDDRATESAVRAGRDGGAGNTASGEQAANRYTRRAGQSTPEDHASADGWQYALVLPETGCHAGARQVDGAADLESGAGVTTPA
jgi:hypothetical protein